MSAKWQANVKVSTKNIHSDYVLLDLKSICTVRSDSGRNPFRQRSRSCWGRTRRKVDCRSRNRSFRLTRRTDIADLRETHTWTVERTKQIINSERIKSNLRSTAGTRFRLALHREQDKEIVSKYSSYLHVSGSQYSSTPLFPWNALARFAKIIAINVRRRSWPPRAQFIFVVPSRQRSCHADEHPATRYLYFTAIPKA